MEEKLIFLIKRKPFLYDKSKPSYKKVELKEAAWESIAIELNKSVEQIKKRWRTLRDRYARELKKMLAPSGSATKSQKNQWKYFDQLSFLSGILGTNYQTTSNYKHEEIEENSTGSFYEDLGSNLERDEDRTSDENKYNMKELPPSETSCSSTNPLQIPSLEEDTERPNPRKRRKMNLNSEILLQITRREMGEFLKVARSSFQRTSASTPLETFFIGLANEIEQSGMSFKQRSALQIKLMTFVHAEISKVKTNCK